MKLFGFLNIYKPVGMTSHDVVACLRKVLKIKQIGHTGTLDPFAEGVLPIAIGKSTRLIEFLDDDKEYIATVQFGKATTTYDSEGEVTFTSDKKVTAAEVEAALKDFQGEILQTPPIYSAIKVKGKKLYEYARKGEDVKIEPRKVLVDAKMQRCEDEKQQAEIVVKCSKGTYIRSIAHDLGKNLGCGGHLIKLIRTKAGKFTVENTINIENTDLQEKIIAPLDMLDLEKIEVTEEDLEKIRHGQSLKNTGIKSGNFVILVYNNLKPEICAVGITEESKILIKKVFLS